LEKLPITTEEFSMSQADGLSVLVLGIGNTLLSDEGAGVATLEFLQQKKPQKKNLRYLDGGTLSFTLTAEIGDSDALIVLDAAELNAEPGAVRCFEGDEMDHFLGTTKRSAHEVGLLDLMDMTRLTDSLPKYRVLVGIQHKSLDWGDQPTDVVAKAIPLAAQEASKIIDKWQASHG